MNDALVARMNQVLPQLTEALPFQSLFETPEITIELFSPVNVDRQSPHDRDELYIVAAGSGLFRRAEEVVEVSAGDLLFVPAWVPHRFVDFSEDFSTWVIFYGEVVQKPGG